MAITISPTNSPTALASSPVDTEALRVELIDIHCRAGHFVAELSDSPTAWVEADPITSRLIAEAHAVHTPTTPANAGDAPAIVRCRELACAQRRMVLALEGNEQCSIDATTVVRARALLAELAELCATLRR